MRRMVNLVTNSCYHIFNRSIESFTIFNTKGEYERFFNTMKYYLIKDVPIPLSKFLQLKSYQQEEFKNVILSQKDRGEINVDIISYCIMPTHIHMILKQRKDNGISNFLRLVLNSYARYFNIKHKRSGPLWQGRFKNVLINSDEQLYHLTRYIHLNPVTSFLVNRPEQWRYSSYMEYLGLDFRDRGFCKWRNILDINPREYKRFVNDCISYQKKLAHIKGLLIE